MVVWIDYLKPFLTLKIFLSKILGKQFIWVIDNSCIEVVFHNALIQQIYFKFHNICLNKKILLASWTGKQTHGSTNKSDWLSMLIQYFSYNWHKIISKSLPKCKYMINFVYKEAPFSPLIDFKQTESFTLWPSFENWIYMLMGRVWRPVILTVWNMMLINTLVNIEVMWYYIRWNHPCRDKIMALKIE